jgi:hypothetical protein
MRNFLKSFATRCRKLPLAILVLLGLIFTVGLWFRVARNSSKATNLLAGVEVHRIERPKGAESKSGSETGEGTGSNRHRQPLQFRAKPVEPEALLAILATGGPTVTERVEQLRRMRGISLANNEMESALSFLAGRQVPEGISRGSVHWLADELLTVMRLQDPPWDGLADELGKAAFQTDTDPVVRDYIMQHLGHLWEQHGARDEIEKTLWQAVAISDETTPGTALIALSRGYERDGQEKELAQVRQQALTLAQNPDSPLAVRVTALSIAGDGGGEEVKRLAGELVGNPETPVILRKVAERVLR